MHLLFSSATKDDDFKYEPGRVGKSVFYQTLIGDIKAQIKEILKSIPDNISAEELFARGITSNHIKQMGKILNEEVNRGPHFFNTVMGGTGSYRNAKKQLDKLDTILSSPSSRPR